MRGDFGWRLHRAANNTRCGGAINRLPERALVIRPEPLSKVLAGTKTWEIRTDSTNIRGLIGLIASGSGEVSGTCRVVDVKGPLTFQEFRRNARKWGGGPSDVERGDHLRFYAWVLKGARRLRRPIPYKHPS